MFFILLVPFFCFFFYENFLFSSSIDLLQFREADDHGFQIIMKSLHACYTHGKIFKAFSFSELGYGTVFWNFFGILTYPFALFGATRFVNFLPRQVSLLLCFCALVYIYKIVKYCTQDKRIALASGLIFFSFPMFATGCMRFHTYGLSLFLSTFCAYLILVNPNPARLNKIIFLLWFEIEWIFCGSSARSRYFGNTGISRKVKHDFRIP